MSGELVDHLPPLDEQPLAEAGANDRGHDQFVRVITAERGHGDHGGPLSQRPIIKQRDGVRHRLERTPYAPGRLRRASFPTVGTGGIEFEPQAGGRGAEGRGTFLKISLQASPGVDWIASDRRRHV